MNIVGNGLIGREFRKVEDKYKEMEVTIFASGVANSGEWRKEEYARETELLAKEIASGRKIVYFSTCSVLQKEANQYIIHKRAIEKLLCESSDCLIVRLPQVVGNNANQNTLLEYFCQNIAAGKQFRVYKNAYRSLIDIEDVARITLVALRENLELGSILNVSSEPQVLAIDIVSWLEKTLNIKGQYNIIDRESDRVDIDLSMAKSLLGSEDIIFEHTYWKDVIMKYYQGINI
jgi:nucleoside-diphosphate-sugar epimerase